MERMETESGRERAAIPQPQTESILQILFILSNALVHSLTLAAAVKG
jgi:hypothetical protein